MIVKKINWISKAAKEAELVVTDGIHECLAFSQPCSLQENEMFTAPLHVIDVENLMKVIDQNIEEKIMKITESYFSQYCVAKVFKANESMVSVGNIIMQFENTIPGWAKDGDFVEFKCSRLDIW